MHEDGDLRVPKIAVSVELTLAEREPRDVTVFVAEHSANSFRRQDLLDLLESESQFLPARDGETWALFNKATVLWMGISLAGGTVSDADIGMAADQLFDVRQPVNVELVGGLEKRGELLYSLPPTRRRVADFLNEPGRFIRVWTPEFVYLINKSYVLRVVEENVPAPATSE